jgi:hypothetical protein
MDGMVPAGAARQAVEAWRLAGIGARRRVFSSAPVVALRAVLPSWLLAHLVVLLVLVLVGWQADGPRLSGMGSGARALLGWDSAWYRDIAEHGYRDAPAGSVRFFPLLPIVTAAVSAVTRLPVGPTLIGLCWLAALAYGALLFDLVRAETGDRVLARRAAWLSQLAPGAAVLVLGYTEGLAGLLAVVLFRLLRAGRSEPLIPVGLACGLVRPTGVLLAVPAALSVLDRRGGLVVRLLAVLSPLLGVCLLLGWSAVAYGDPLLPYTTQTQASLRGAVAANPLPYLWHRSGGAAPWPVNLVLLVTALGLLVVCARRLPFAYTIWSVLLVLAAVTAAGLHSLPRYLAAVFPLLIAAAALCRGRVAFAGALAFCLPLFAFVAYLGFLGHLVP